MTKKEKRWLRKKIRTDRAIAAGNRLSNQEVAVVDLERMQKLAEGADAEFVGSLLSIFKRRGYLTGAQWHWVKEMNERLGQKSRAIARLGKRDRHYLYAIRDGATVKLGFSVNPESRLKTLQTGAINSLEIIWRLEVGDRPRAKTAERKLHRFCKPHHIRGEWFKATVMELLEGFEIRWRTRNFETEIPIVVEALAKQ